MQLRAQAKQLLIKHEFAQAEELLTQALQLTPGSYKLLRLRSVAFACSQQYQRSLQVGLFGFSPSDFVPNYNSSHAVRAMNISLAVLCVCVMHCRLTKNCPMQ